MATGSPVVRGWLRLAYRLGSGLARRGVGPNAITAVGLLLCLAVPAAALGGTAGLVAGALLTLMAVVADGLDGPVALLTGRASRLGFVYDSVADRVGELAWLTAFWLIGAPGWLVVAAGAASWLQEYARARATAAGMAEIGVVTVAERPTRALISIFGLLSCAVVPSVAWRVADLATAAVAVWTTLAFVGLMQLGRVTHRHLNDDYR